MEFITWAELATYAGSIAMVAAATQFTKGIKLIERIPTQLWSYMIALVILYAAYFFTGQLDLSMAGLIPFNAILVSLAANGGYEAVARAMGKG